MKKDLVRHMRSHWPSVSLAGLSLCTLVLVWLVRDTPHQWLSVIRLDALSAFFLFATLAGLTLISWIGSSRLPIHRTCILLVTISIALSVTFLPAIGLAYVVLALLIMPPKNPRGRDQGSAGRDHGPGVRGQQAEGSNQGPAIRGQDLDPQSKNYDLKSKILRHLAPRTWHLIPGTWFPILATACLLISYAALVFHGVARYDDRIAGSAFNSFVFGFVLLAATVPHLPRRRIAQHDQLASLCRIAWLYPLVRLYSLGPWNTGWAFATLLFGAAATLWASASALTEPDHTIRGQRLLSSYAALAIAGFGLGTGAGIVAGCYSVLTYLILNGQESAGSDVRDQGPGTRGQESGDSLLVPDLWPSISAASAASAVPAEPLSSWVLSGALPFTAPFTAAWMLIGAATAGNVILLAGIAWLASLLNALTVALRAPFVNPQQQRVGVAIVSGVIGVGAPLVVRVLIEPVIEQLQGGLTPYGDINLWPWIGLAIRNSASQQVTVLPSIAVVALMLVLAAFVYLVVRLCESYRHPDTSSSETQETSLPVSITAARLRSIIAFLRSEVVWLNTQPQQRPTGEQRSDGE